MITEIIINPPVVTLVDDRTRARWRDLGPRVECFDCGINSECSECDNDLPYSQPVVRGDKLFLQFLLSDGYNADVEDPEFGWFDGDPDWFVRASIEFKSGATLVLPSSGIVLDAGVGYYDGQSYQNITLDSAAIFDYINSELGLTSDCFRIVVESQIQENDRPILFGVYTSLPPVIPLNNIKIVVNDTEYRTLQAGGIWFWFPTGVTYVGGDIVFGAYGTVYPGLWKQFNGVTWEITDPPSRGIATGPSCRTDWYVEATCTDTLTIEGYHGNKDCNGHIYAPIATDYQTHEGYRDYYRIHAGFEVKAFPIEITNNEDGEQVASKLSEQGTLVATTGTPKFYAEKIARTLVAKRIFINGIEYYEPTNVERLNDDGKNWYYSVTLSRILCKTSPDCDGTVEYIPVVPVDQAECPDCPFLPILLHDSDGNVLETVTTYPPGGIIIAPDGSYELRDEDGNLVSSGIIRSGETSKLITASNASYDLRDTAGIILYSGTILSGGSENIVAPDVEILRDGAPYAFGKSGSTVNVISAGIIPSGIYYRRPFSSQKTSFRTGDAGWHLQNGTFNFSNPTNPAVFQELDYSATNWFFTLLHNNAFGNKFRFTNSVGSEALDGMLNFSGAKTYTTGGGINYYVIDHLTGLGFYVANLGNLSTGWNDNIDAAHAQRAANLLGFNDWFPVTMAVLHLIQFRDAAAGSVQSILKRGIVSGYNESFPWTCDTQMTATGSAFYYRQGNEFQSIAKTSTSINTIYVCRAHY